MAHVVVLGAGLGGVLMAYEMKAKLGPSDRLTVVNLGDRYSFVPSNPWVAVGWRKREEIAVELAPIFARRGIELRPEGASRVHPGENRIELNDGTSVDYDYLDHRHRTRPRLRRDPRARPERQHPVDLPYRSCREGEACRRRAGQVRRPGRHRRRPGRLLLRPGLRIRLHSRHRPSPRQDARPGADDLRHARALYRASRPRRRRRHQGAAGERPSRASHQMDHQRQGDQGRARQDVRRGGRRQRRRQGHPRASLRLLDDAAGLPRHCRRARHRGADQPARLHRHRQVPAQPGLQERLRRRRRGRHSAGRQDAACGRRAQDRLHDRVDGDGRPPTMSRR